MAGNKHPLPPRKGPKNDVPPVPELQGKPKYTKQKAKPITEP